MEKFGENKNQLLEKYGPYVKSIAAGICRQFRFQVELDELMAYGQMGLLEAAERFEPSIGANFLTFAHYRVKGAIFDGLRKMGFLSGVELSASVAERANAYLSNLSDRDAGGYNSFAEDIGEISSAVSGLAIIYATSLEAAESLQVVERFSAEEHLELEQTKKRIRKAMGMLSEKERRVLQVYYFDSKTLEEAGAEIGQSKSWASRLHARAIEKLKQLLVEDARQSEETTLKRRETHGGTTHGGSSSAGGAAKASRSSDTAGQAGSKQIR
ncbi:MAG: sigma-70 family RNA polymerase sigma factor [Proteobacteria bacterium]|nr:sigma-70 family RNA polymerase sigma factor [Cystobacterineae bacterium]MCL2258764.1 sigma-70 family RNA polymerase sigma factor [Cystobacterineae bacterium]MCL2314383.1 sigma-70 family RNA polymerase sigma factor [Pseudomonadota bacterium]